MIIQLKFMAAKSQSAPYPPESISCLWTILYRFFHIPLNWVELHRKKISYSIAFCITSQRSKKVVILPARPSTKWYIKHKHKRVVSGHQLLLTLLPFFTFMIYSVKNIRLICIALMRTQKKLNNKQVPNHCSIMYCLFSEVILHAGRATT